MGPQPPSFASQEYWETRFQHNTSPFDWLLPAGDFAFDKHITKALSTTSESSPSILHIGSGTSLLSFHLRNHVSDPGQIHNVDFSQNAVIWGIQYEEKLFGQSCDAETRKKEAQNVEDKARHDSTGIRSDANCGRKPGMRWTQVNLLSLTSVLSSFPSSKYLLVIDKSCCDAIACGEDVEIPLPFEVYSSTNGSLNTPKRDRHSKSRFVHPVILLALHLALVTPPGARWVAMSYSSDRFPFITNPDADEDTFEMKSKGFPVPSDLWKLVCKEPVEAAAENTEDIAGRVVFRPAVSNWSYCFERTETILKTWDSWTAGKMDG